jgi:hypothetical protein
LAAILDHLLKTLQRMVLGGAEYEVAVQQVEKSKFLKKPENK